MNIKNHKNLNLILGEFKKSVSSRLWCVFLSVHSREDMYSYQFIFLAGRFVYLVSLCVYMLPSWYTRDHPTRKSPIWLRHAPVLCFQLHKHLKVRTPNPGKFSLQKLISHICSYFCRFQLKQDA